MNIVRQYIYDKSPISKGDYVVIDEILNQDTFKFLIRHELNKIYKVRHCKMCDDTVNCKNSCPNDGKEIMIDGEAATGGTVGVFCCMLKVRKVRQPYELN